ncbi:MAG: hypothetical protein IH948_09600 [Bacteroidetes bacterium]|nr:hypothetical protein [Bacteroidota bacterium]
MRLTYSLAELQKASQDVKSAKNKEVIHLDHKVADSSGLDERSDDVELGNLMEELEEQLNKVVSTNNRLAALYHKLANNASDEKLRDFYFGLEKRTLRDQKEFHDVLNGYIECPNCGSSNQLSIVYGSQGRKVRKGVIFGGCVATENDPRWHCEDCSFKWRYTVGDNK